MTPMLRALVLGLLAPSVAYGLAARPTCSPRLHGLHVALPGFAPSKALRSPTAAATMAMPPSIRRAAPLVPGLAVTAALAQISEWAAASTSLSPLLWATLFGMVVRPSIILVALILRKTLDARAVERLAPGVSFAKAKLLRAGIVLYGAKLTMQQIFAVGLAGLLADAFTVVSVLVLGVKVGVGVLKLDRPLATLISMGAAICGCSAVVATQPVVEGESHEVAAAVGTVVLCGTVAMFLYPYLYNAVPFLAADPRLMGIFTGATVHEIAGVVAAGNAMGSEVATTAIVTKLVRVALLAPTLLVLSSKCPGLRARTGDDDARAAVDAPGRPAAQPAPPPFPGFVLGFVAVTLLNSIVPFDRAVVKRATQASAFALAMAMAALGLDADVSKVQRLGPRPVVLAGLLWAHLLVVGAAVSRVLVAVFPA